MNAPKAIEQALAAAIRKHADVGRGVVLRCWQSLKADGTWTARADRTFPCVDIRCAPAEHDAAAMPTLIAECGLLCATKTDDDKDHAAISQLYGAVSDVVDQLYAGSRERSNPPAIYKEFLAALAASVEEQQAGSATVEVGGLTFGTPVAPYDEDGLNVIGLAVRVHYSRSDF